MHLLGTGARNQKHSLQEKWGRQLWNQLIKIAFHSLDELYTFQISLALVPDGHGVCLIGISSSLIVPSLKRLLSTCRMFLGAGNTDEQNKLRCDTSLAKP